MGTIARFVAAVALLVFAGFTAAEQVPVQGAELKGLVVTEKGSTWTLSNGSRLTFLPNMMLVDCTGKPGWETCDDGTYVLTDNSIERKYNTWFKEAGGARKAVVKKDGDKLVFNGFDVVRYSMTPTLLPATTEQIASLAGKDFKQNLRDEGLQKLNFSKGMTLFACNRDNCNTNLPLKITAPWVEVLEPDAPSWKALVVIENEKVLWRGRELIPDDPKSTVDVPASCAGFAGGWGANWGGGVGPTRLWVTDIQPDCTARVSYLSSFSNTPPERYFRSEIKDGKLIVRCGNDGKCTFTSHGDQIWATYLSGSGTNSAVFQKIK